MFVRDLTANLRALQSLEVIDLDMHMDVWGRFKTHLGPGGYLSLKDLPNLRKISLPLGFLLALRSRENASLFAVLPPSLEELTIYGCTFCSQVRDPHGCEAVIAIIESLLSPPRHHHLSLKKVTYFDDIETSEFCTCHTVPVPHEAVRCGVHSPPKQLGLASFPERPGLVEEFALRGVTLFASERHLVPHYADEDVF